MRGFLRRPRRLSTAVVVAVTLGVAGPVVLGTSVADAATCPCSIWGTNVTPERIDSGDSTPVNVGVKFQASIPGTVTSTRGSV